MPARVALRFHLLRARARSSSIFARLALSSPSLLVFPARSLPPRAPLFHSSGLLVRRTARFIRHSKPRKFAQPHLGRESRNKTITFEPRYQLWDSQARLPFALCQIL